MGQLLAWTGIAPHNGSAPVASPCYGVLLCKSLILDQSKPSSTRDLNTESVRSSPISSLAVSGAGVNSSLAHYWMVLLS